MKIKIKGKDAQDATEDEKKKLKEFEAVGYEVVVAELPNPGTCVFYGGRWY